MGLFAAVKSCFVNYVNFRTRAGRGEFWNWALFVVLLTIPSSLADSIYGMFTITGPALALVALPSMAVLVRRLRDVGRSGWSALISLTIIGLLPLAFWCAKKSVWEAQHQEHDMSSQPISSTESGSI